MKAFILLALLLGSTLNASAAIPNELLDLLPENTNRIRLEGKTQDNQNCEVEISKNNYSFSSTIFVMQHDGSLDSERLARFQIGLGHNLQSLEKNGSVIIAQSEHKADESYSSDSRATLTANKDSSIRSIQILNEESGFFGWSKVRDETCLVEKYPTPRSHLERNARD